MRWGIETSFRSLKYALGLIHLHAKKPDLVLQEISPVFSSSTSENYSLSAPVEPRQGLKSRATAFPPAAPPHAEPLFTLLFQAEFPPSSFAVYFSFPQFLLLFFHPLALWRASLRANLMTLLTVRRIFYLTGETDEKRTSENRRSHFT